MKQKLFEAQYSVLWQEIEQTLKSKEGPGPDFPQRYRRLCLHLALASQRGYSPALTDYLQQLVHLGHQTLYGVSVERPAVLFDWLTRVFPQRVRAEWRLLLLSLIAFFGVGLIVGALVWYQPHWAYSFASPEQLAEYRAMYAPGSIKAGRGGAEGDVGMFGFYIWNNVSIGFRTFASGIFAGVPSLISLTSNGMHFGVIAAWLTVEESTRTPFWSFVITHSSFEVMGLLLSAVSGMKLGFALVAPGRRTRRRALTETATMMFPIMVGAAILTMVAAFFEGFFSASTSITHSVKYIVGSICWSLLLLYFLLAGRSRAHAAG